MKAEIKLYGTECTTEAYSTTTVEGATGGELRRNAIRAFETEIDELSQNGDGAGWIDFTIYEADEGEDYPVGHTYTIDL